MLTYTINCTTRTGDYGDFSPHYIKDFDNIVDALNDFAHMRKNMYWEFEFMYVREGKLDDVLLSLEVYDPEDEDGEIETLHEERYTYADFLRDSVLHKVTERLPEFRPMTKQEYDQLAKEALVDFAQTL